MSDEPTIRYCLEHDTIDMMGVDSCVYRTGVVPCRIVTLRRRPVVVERGAWYEPGGFGDKPNVGFIWTEEP